jgi:hypothetical protein
MSTNLKNKMLNHIETPPVGVWESIAFKLDVEEKLATENILAKKLNNYQEAPPVSVWDNIAIQLNNEEEQYNSVATKLLAYEVAPPNHVWQNISTEINKEETKVIPIGGQRKIGTYLKFAAAASVIAIISSTIWFVANKPTPNNDSSLANTTNTSVNKTTVAASTNKNNSLLTTDTQEKNTVSNNTNKKVDKQIPSTTKNKEIAAIDLATVEQTSPLAKNPFDKKADPIQNSTGDAPLNIDLVATPNTYMTIVGPDGQSVRISSKFSKQVGYFTERSPDAMENIDVIIKEGKVWRTKIASWKELLNSSTISPSITNFMDVLEMSTILTDKKK